MLNTKRRLLLWLKEKRGEVVDRLLLLGVVRVILGKKKIIRTPPTYWQVFCRHIACSNLYVFLFCFTIFSTWKCFLVSMLIYKWYLAIVITLVSLTLITILISYSHSYSRRSTCVRTRNRVRFYEQKSPIALTRLWFNYPT